MSRAKKFGILFLAANLVPALAFGAAPTKHVAKKKPVAVVVETAAVVAPVIPVVPIVAAVVLQPRDLTLADAKTSFINFSADIVAKDSDSRAKLFGMIYKACQDKFTFSIPTTDQGLAFEIRDKGDGAACMKDLRDKNGDQCESESVPDSVATHKCVRLSTLVSIDLKDKDGDIGLYSIHDNEDQSREHFKKIGKLHFKSAATLAAEDDARLALERSRRVDKYRNEVSACVNDQDEIGVARGALASLLNMGELQDGELDSITASLDMAELVAIDKEADSASLDDLATTREKLHTLSVDHPKMSEQIATVLHKIAMRYWDAGQDNPDGFKLAKETISEAQGLKGLKQASIDKLKINQNEITYGMMDNLAESGDGYGFYNSYKKQMMGLQKEYNKECGGKRASMEVCMNTITTLQRSSQLPTTLNQTLQKQWQDQQRIQQQMQDAQNAAITAAQKQQQANPQQQTTTFAGGYINTQSPWSDPSGFNPLSGQNNTWAGSTLKF